MRTCDWHLSAPGMLRLAAMAAVTLSGCGKPSATVTGTVLVGGEPLLEGSITFYPEDKTAGGTTGGRITKGNYEVLVGLTAGRYRIAIEGTRPHPTKTERLDFSDESIPLQVPAVPEKYRGQDSPLIVTIEPGHQDHSFELDAITVDEKPRR